MQIKYDKSNCPAFGLYNARVPWKIVALWKKYDERVINLATCLSSGMKILPEKFYGKFSSRDFSCPNRLDVKRGHRVVIDLTLGSKYTQTIFGLNTYLSNDVVWF